MTDSSACPPYRSWFAARLKALRISRGFSTARKFASALGIDENRYTRYERAEVEPDLTLLWRMLELLKATPNDLLDMTATAGDLSNNANGFFEPGAEPPTPPVRDPAAIPLRRVFAWQLAGEIAKIDVGGSASKFDLLGQVSRIQSDIEADPFAFLARLTADRRFAELPPETATQIGTLAERMIDAINADRLVGERTG